MIRNAAYDANVGAKAIFVAKHIHLPTKKERMFFAPFCALN